MSARTVLATLGLVACGCGSRTPPAASPHERISPAAVLAPTRAAAATPLPPRPEPPEAAFRDVSPELGDPSPFRLPKAQTWTLPSGVRVILVEDGDALTVSARAVVTTGGTPGMLSLAMQTIGCGTKRFPKPGDVKDALREAQATRETQWAITDVELAVTMPHYAAAAGLGVLTELVAAPAFEGECVERVIHGLKETARAAPTSGGIVGAVRRAQDLEKGLPDRVQVTDAVLAAASRDTIAVSYEAAVRPAQTTVVVAGNITRTALNEALAPLAQPWPKAAIPAHPAAKGTVARASGARARAVPPSLVLVDGPGVGKVHVNVSVAAPRARVSDRAAMDLTVAVISLALSRGLDELFRNRPERAWTTALTSYDNGEDQRVSWNLDVSPDDLEAALRIYQAAAGSLADGGLTTEQLRTARRARVTKLATILDSPSEVAKTFANAVRVGDSVAELQDAPKGALDVQADDVRRAAARLALRDAAITVVARRPQIEATLSRVIGRPIEMRDASGKRTASEEAPAKGESAK